MDGNRYQYQAYAKGCRVTACTPRQAAEQFFQRHPERRKCNVTEGRVDGMFFVTTYGRAADGEWSQRWADVTKKTAGTLPDVARELARAVAP